MATLSISPLSIPLSKAPLRLLPKNSVSGFPFVSQKRQNLGIKKPVNSIQSVDFLSPLTSLSSQVTRTRVSPNGVFDSTEERDVLKLFDEKPVRFALWVVFWASISLVWFATSNDANAAVDSIKASGFGLKIADALRGFGWSDQAVVFVLATLPVLELRGAIPVGYWMQRDPVLLTVLAVIGNMVPVPFIIIYLKKFASFLAGKNQSASRLLEMLFQNAKEKAGPVEEFQWLGLMLFVAVPFPGTGAWTGAIIASILDMPFWPAFTANFFGVVLAGLLVNLLVNLGLKYAVITGIVLFFISTFMWSVLRNIRKSFSTSSQR